MKKIVLIISILVSFTAVVSYGQQHSIDLEKVIRKPKKINNYTKDFKIVNSTNNENAITHLSSNENKYALMDFQVIDIIVNNRNNELDELQFSFNQDDFDSIGSALEKHLNEALDLENEKQWSKKKYYYVLKKQDNKAYFTIKNKSSIINIDEVVTKKNPALILTNNSKFTKKQYEKYGQELFSYTNTDNNTFSLFNTYTKDIVYITTTNDELIYFEVHFLLNDDIAKQIIERFESVYNSTTDKNNLYQKYLQDKIQFNLANGGNYNLEKKGTHLLRFSFTSKLAQEIESNYFSNEISSLLSGNAMNSILNKASRYDYKSGLMEEGGELTEYRMEDGQLVFLGNDITNVIARSRNNKVYFIAFTMEKKEINAPQFSYKKMREANLKDNIPEEDVLSHNRKKLIKFYDDNTPITANAIKYLNDNYTPVSQDPDCTFDCGDEWKSDLTKIVIEKNNFFDENDDQSKIFINQSIIIELLRNNE